MEADIRAGRDDADAWIDMHVVVVVVESTGRPTCPRRQGYVRHDRRVGIMRRPLAVQCMHALRSGRDDSTGERRHLHAPGDQARAAGVCGCGATVPVVSRRPDRIIVYRPRPSRTCACRAPVAAGSCAPSQERDRTRAAQRTRRRANRPCVTPGAVIVRTTTPPCMLACILVLH